MAAKKKPAGSSFTSFRILGEKAQRLLERARELKKAKTTDGGVPLPEEPERPELTVHLSTRSVVRSTFAILAIALGVLLIYLLQEKLVLLVLAVFVSVVMDPGVRWLERMGIPHRP